MALFVYITEQCKKDAEKHSFTEALINVKEKLETTQEIDMFDAYPPPYLVRKKFGDAQGRLIAARQELNVDGIDYTVIILLAVLIRSDINYAGDKGFGNDPVSYGNEHFKPILEKLDLESFVRERV
ncbi:MAG: hypothetical protein J6X08_05180 [Lachnospiraceae bacterium]|nr:hypothetical protein [Lachnospiraceae bacterium]